MRSDRKCFEAILRNMNDAVHARGLAVNLKEQTFPDTLGRTTFVSLPSKNMFLVTIAPRPKNLSQ